MNNISKCIGIIEKCNADAMILTNEANMHYLCGFSPSEGMVLIFKNGDAFHLVDSRYTERAQKYSVESGLTAIEYEKNIYQSANDLIKNHSAKTVIYESETISLKAYNCIKEYCCGTDLLPLGDLLMRERNRKEPSEIVLMKKANQIAEKSFLELLNYIEAGKTEKELAAHFDYIMAQNGSDGISFDTILLSGANTSMPHGVPSNKKIRNGEFVLFDFGATYNGYHSDMTRTIVVGEPTEEMINDYNLVLEAQMAGIKSFNAGTKCCDVYKSAYDVLNAGGMAEYFRHGLGHGLGLEIHEGFNASPRSKDVYEAGNVSSIEPGIYIPNKYGIRIEDVCYLSTRGRENLSNITKRLITI